MRNPLLVFRFWYTKDSPRSSTHTVLTRPYRPTAKEPEVTNAVLYSYLIGWAVTSIGLALSTRHQSRSASVVVVTGAVWPLLLLGAVQFVALALVAEALRVRESGPKSIDDELEELLAEWAISDADALDHSGSVTTGGDNAHESGADMYRQTVVPLDN